MPSKKDTQTEIVAQNIYTGMSIHMQGMVQSHNATKEAKKQNA